VALSPGTRLGAYEIFEWRAGNPDAADELMSVLYGELRQLDGAIMRRERPDHTLQTTALVHEAYLRLCGNPLRRFD
jgi:ECF sigma factor